MANQPSIKQYLKKPGVIVGFLGLCTILLTGGYFLYRAQSGNQVPVQTTAVQITTGSPTLTPTASPNAGFLPLVSKPETPTPTPTATLTPTPTITPTPTPLILSFCDQAPAPLAITDYETITDTLAVSYDGMILDLDIELEINHGYSGDLIATLKKENSQPTVLLARPGPPPAHCPGKDISAVFNDEALTIGNSMCNQTPPSVGGMVRPLQPLFTYDNQNVSGLWQLVLSDQSAPDSGELVRWCLIATLR
jgi:hypothetical protein